MASFECCTTSCYYRALGPQVLAYTSSFRYLFCFFFFFYVAVEQILTFMWLLNRQKKGPVQYDAQTNIQWPETLGTKAFCSHATFVPVIHLRTTCNNYTEYPYLVRVAIECCYGNIKSLYGSAMAAYKPTKFKCRYLSSGALMQDIALSFRVGISTAREAVQETCAALWSRLKPLYMPVSK